MIKDIISNQKSKDLGWNITVDFEEGSKETYF